MKNPKLFALLDTLEENEVSDFHKYLKQQHGKEAVALQVFDYVRKHWGDEDKLELTYAFRKIFKAEISGSATHRKKILNAYSDLNLWLKDFLLTEKALKNTFENQVLWLGILQERGLEDAFSKAATQFFEETNAAPQKGIKGHIRQATANYFHYQHLLRAKAQVDQKAFEQCMQTLGACSEILQLKMASEKANMQKYLPPNDTKKAEPKPAVLLLIYRELHQLLITEQEVHFHQLNKMLVENIETLDSVELQELLKHLYNYAAQQIRNGKEAVFVKALHLLNLFGLEHNFFTEKGVMSATNFSNIVNIACSVQDFDWISKFVASKSKLLPDDIREDTVAQTKALIFFEKKAFRKALKVLESTEFKDFKFVIRSRSLVLRSYYELGEDVDKIVEYCINFEALLRRQPKTQAGFVEATLAFTSVFKAMAQGKGEKQALVQKVNETPNMYFKKWLLEKLEEYDGSY